MNCCSARSLDADRRGKVLIRSDSGGSNDDAEQQSGYCPVARSLVGSAANECVPRLLLSARCSHTPRIDECTF